MQKRNQLLLWLLGLLCLCACETQAHPESPPPTALVTSSPTTLMTPTTAITSAMLPNVTATTNPLTSTLPVLPTVPALRPPTCNPNPQDFMPRDVRGTRVAHFSPADTDGDGRGEWVLLYQANDVGYGLVIHCLAEQGKAYVLGGETPLELFREKIGTLLVKDVNADGKNELVIEGVLKGKGKALHIFQWDGSGYKLLLKLQGDEGMALDDAQQTGLYDFTALQLLHPRSFIIHTTLAEWQRTQYATRNHILFLFGIPLAFNHPEEATLAYYALWHKRQANAMWELLTEPQRSRMTLADLQALCNGSEEVSVEALGVDEESADQATVTASIVVTAKGEPQKLKHRWRLRKEGKEWRLAELQ